MLDLPTPLRRSGLAVALAGIAAMSLTACSAAATGQLAIAVDPAGRLLAVVALCDGQSLSTLTLTDVTTGTSTTVRPKQSPASGSTIILTGPVANPRPEGALDLLDRAHEYSLTGTTTDAGGDEETGSLPAVRFRLADVINEKRLSSGFVLATRSEEPAVTEKADFLAQAGAEC